LSGGVRRKRTEDGFVAAVGELGMRRISDNIKSPE